MAALTDSSLSMFTGGSFGTVYKAIDKHTGEIVAVKHVRSR
jgi:serine/threonine protein kinase